MASRIPHFNPRTPCGVRQMETTKLGNGFDISIHAPHAGCDHDLDRRLIVFTAISIHAPHAGCD